MMVGEQGTGKTALSNRMLSRFGTKLLDTEDVLVRCSSSVENYKTFCEYA